MSWCGSPAPDLDVKPNERPPLNLSLVLDRSGSMEDKGKIEYLRQAAKLAVGQLCGARCRVGGRVRRPHHD